MISRVAESCFWLQRYLERADNTARMLEVNCSTMLETASPGYEHWRPLLIVAGEEQPFLDLLGEGLVDDSEAVQEYMVWDERNIASIYNSMHMARENARTIRETISLEMWEALNSTWLWLTGSSGHRLYRTERQDFYSQLKASAQLQRGLIADTLLHDEAYCFMRLGTMTERAAQTARILDVKHHQLGPSDPVLGSVPEETTHWLAILRTCSSTEAFFKRGSSLSGASIMDFLMLDPELPRSARHCLDAAAKVLDIIRGLGGHRRGSQSADTLDQLRQRLDTKSVARLLGSQVHDELTTIINEIAKVCSLLHAEFFDPGLSEAIDLASNASEQA